MIWLVWNSDGESEADAKRIDAQDYIKAAEEWARLDGCGEPANREQHLRNGLDLRARADGHGQFYRVRVEAESSINYFGSEGDVTDSGGKIKAVLADRACRAADEALAAVSSGASEVPRSNLDVGHWLATEVHDPGGLPTFIWRCGSAGELWATWDGVFVSSLLCCHLDDLEPLLTVAKREAGYLKQQAVAMGMTNG